MKFISNNLKAQTMFLVGALILAVSGSVVVFATNTYSPGETLNPACSVGDANCDVVVPAISGSNSDITALSGLTTALSVAQGGTAATTTALARTSLGLDIGSDVQAYNVYLADIADLSPSQGDVIYYNGSDWTRLAAGTSGYYLKTLGVGVNPAWAAAPAASSVDGSGATSNVAFWTDSDTLSSSSSLYWDNTNGRLGINDATPAYALDVNGELRIVNTSTLASVNTTGPIVADFDSGVSRIGDLSAFANGSVALRVDADSGYAGIYNEEEGFWESWSNGTYNYFKNSVGIGTDTPDTQFEMYQSSGTQELRLSGNGEQIQKISLVQEGDSWAHFLYDYPNGYAEIGTLQDEDFHIVTNSSNKRLTVKSDGKIGIATTTPAYDLDVDGTMRVVNTSTFSTVLSDDNFKVSVPNGSSRVFSVEPSSHSIYIGDPDDSNTGSYFFVDGGSAVSAFIGGSVGIGDATPSYDLDVNGTLRTTGNTILATTTFSSILKLTPIPGAPSCGSGDDGNIYFSEDGGYPCYCEGESWKNFSSDTAC